MITKHPNHLSLKLGFEVMQCILFLWLAWLVAGCGNQADSAAVPTAPVPLPATVPAQPTPAPTATLIVTTPATPTSIPTTEVDPEAQTFYYKGLTYMAAGLPEEAMTSFDQAIVLQPDYALAYLERGKLYMQQGQLAQAKSDYDHALELTNEPKVKAEVKELLQQLVSRMPGATDDPTITPTPQVVSATPLPTIAANITPGPPLEAQLEQPFTLPIGHTARLQESDLTLAFLAVVEDSRCPTQVDCFWSGQARIIIRVQQGQIEATPFELNTLY
ncbi:MAG: tetratricopeptide repeat protein, partial [Gammaproteobacteria bacterium]